MSFIVKNTTFPSPLDLLAPHSCRGCGKIGTPLCKCCKNDIIAHKFNLCPNCKTKLSPSKYPNCPKCRSLPPIYVVGERSGLLDSLIHDYKYNSSRALAKPLAELLDAKLPEIPHAILVPLPTATHHIRSRSLDHTRLIARHLSRLRHYKVQPLLLRQTNTTQVGSDHHTRLTQAEHAYKINSRLPIDQHATYILFDDVWTTGASMKAAIKKLRAAGVSHLIVTLLAVSRLD